MDTKSGSDHESRLPPEFDAESASASRKADFLIVAEFCEIEGPKPLFTIPARIDPAFDQDGFALRMLSADTQSFLSPESGFDLPDETHLVLTEPENDISALILYSTFGDLAARGFSRAFCIAYVTPDADKLMRHLDDIIDDLSPAASCLKYGNRVGFLTDVRRRRCDLTHTRDVLAAAAAAAATGSMTPGSTPTNGSPDTDSNNHNNKADTQADENETPADTLAHIGELLATLEAVDRAVVQRLEAAPELMRLHAKHLHDLARGVLASDHDSIRRSSRDTPHRPTLSNARARARFRDRLLTQHAREANDSTAQGQPQEQTQGHGKARVRAETLHEQSARAARAAALQAVANGAALNGSGVQASLEAEAAAAAAAALAPGGEGRLDLRAVFNPALYTPHVVDVGRSRNFRAELKTMRELTGVFYNDALSKLAKVREHYHRRLGVLALEQKDALLLAPASSLLTIGRCVVLNFHLEPSASHNVENLVLDYAIPDKGATAGLAPTLRHSSRQLGSSSAYRTLAFQGGEGGEGGEEDGHARGDGGIWLDGGGRYIAPGASPRSDGGHRGAAGAAAAADGSGAERPFGTEQLRSSSPISELSYLDALSYRTATEHMIGDSDHDTSMYSLRSAGALDDGIGSPYASPLRTSSRPTDANTNAQAATMFFPPSAAGGAPRTVLVLTPSDRDVDVDVGVGVDADNDRDDKDDKDIASAAGAGAAGAGATASDDDSSELVDSSEVVACNETPTVRLSSSAADTLQASVDSPSRSNTPLGLPVTPLRPTPLDAPNAHSAADPDPNASTNPNTDREGDGFDAMNGTAATIESARPADDAGLWTEIHTEQPKPRARARRPLRARRSASSDGLVKLAQLPDTEPGAGSGTANVNPALAERSDGGGETGSSPPRWTLGSGDTGSSNSKAAKSSGLRLHRAGSQPSPLHGLESTRATAMAPSHDVMLSPLGAAGSSVAVMQHSPRADADARPLPIAALFRDHNSTAGQPRREIRSGSLRSAPRPVPAAERHVLEGLRASGLDASKHSKHAFQSAADHLAHPSPDKLGTGMLQLRDTYSFLPQVVHALLSGRCVFVIAKGEREEEVRRLVRALWFCVPGHSPWNRVVAWRSTTALAPRFADLSSLKLVGMTRHVAAHVSQSVLRQASVLDLDACSFSGVQYTGHYVSAMLDRQLHFPSDAALLAHMHDIYLQLARKSFLYYHDFCLRTDREGPQALDNEVCSPWHDETKIREFFKTVAVFGSDVDIVRNLTETVKRQQEAAYLKASGFKDGKLAYGEKKEVLGGLGAPTLPIRLDYRPKVTFHNRSRASSFKR